MQIDKPAIKRQFLKCRILQCIFGCFLGCSLFSCGKPINESDDGKVTRTPGATGSIIYLDNQAGGNTQFTFKESGQLYLPPTLFFRGGARTHQVRIDFAPDTDISFYCLYTEAQEEVNYEFENCHADEDTSKDKALGYAPGANGPKIIMEEGHIIKIDETTPTIFEAEFDVQWF